MPAMSKLLLTMREVSELTGIPVETLRYWRKRRRGEGPPAVQTEGRVKYRTADVITWVDSLPTERTGATGTDG
jgi:DNA-binding transcriptional MerR regulator